MPASAIKSMVRPQLLSFITAIVAQFQPRSFITTILMSRLVGRRHIGTVDCQVFDLCRCLWLLSVHGRALVAHGSGFGGSLDFIYSVWFNGKKGELSPARPGDVCKETFAKDTECLRQACVGLSGLQARAIVDTPWNDTIRCILPFSQTNHKSREWRKRDRKRSGHRSEGGSKLAATDWVCEAWRKVPREALDKGFVYQEFPQN